MSHLTRYLLLLPALSLFASSVIAQSWHSRIEAIHDQYPYLENASAPAGRSAMNPPYRQSAVYRDGIHGNARAYKMTIFGDGNRRNGIEDDREDVRTLYERGELDHVEPVSAAGTIKCIGIDGKEQIGSAEIINVDKITGKGHSKGFSIGVTVAHVLVNEDGKSKRDCYYHPLNSPSIKFKIKKKIVGEHYKIEDGAKDWASFVLEEDLDTDYGAFQFSSLSDKKIQQFQKKGGQIHLVGYNFSMGTINLVRRNCFVVDRKEGDMRYGDTRVYTNSCESNGGSSGGGLLANYADRYLLLGVNVGGIHKLEAFPYGPMPGEPFDTKSNVNMAVKFQGKFLKAIKKLARNPF